MGDSPCFAIPHAHSPSAFQHPHQFNGSLAQPRLPLQRHLGNPHHTMDTPRSTLKRKPSEDIDSPMPSSGPPSPSENNSDSNSDQAKVKRVRTTIQRVSKQKTVSKLIGTLTNAQLINLVNTLVDSHPSLAEDISNLVPRPTIASVQPYLAALETKMQESFPYTKWGPSYDDYSFNRVKPALDELVENLVDYTNHFTSPPEFPTTSFSFLHIATEFCHRLPNWDNPANNEHKSNLYKSLADFWIKAIQDASSKLEEGKIYGQMTVQEWAKNLEQHNNTSQGMFSSAIEEFKTKLGWIIGIHTPASSFSGALSSGSPRPSYGGVNSNHNHGSNGNNHTNNGSNGNNSSDGAGSPYQGQHHTQQLQHQHQQSQQQPQALGRNVGLGFHTRR
ncbi:Cut8 six-helix bundle-domain-containing protein [Linnemannia elongata]|nr:Cut8 six-helix bundle-domain-containing protein [Linnemannia elongata]KAK5808940.1 Cut8 six-helix bundle-domain-containing protein [Linnemannia elongata]